jgi:hypothetical protein
MAVTPPPTTTANRARSALNECAYAIRELPDPPNDLWRRRWTTVVTLLRTVGLALKNFDAPRGDAAFQEAVDVKWQEPKPSIFKDFIDAERYGVVHLFDFVAQSVVIVECEAKPVETGGTVLEGKRAYNQAKMITGPYAGRDPVELAKEAWRWWRDYLDAVDAEAARLRARTSP